MADEATPSGQKEKQQTSAEAQEATPSKEGQEETGATSSQKEVEALKTDMEKLKGELAKTAARQSVADKRAQAAELKAKNLSSQLKKAQFSFEEPEEEEEEPSNPPVERDEEIIVENKVKDLLLGNPQYRELLEKDETLKDILLRNPLALLTTAFSVEDAVEQIKEKLEKKVEAYNSSQPKEEKKSEEKEEEKGKEFEAGPPKATSDISKANELISKGRIDEGIEEAIKSKLNFS